MSSNDIPLNCRGTIRIGQQTLHYERSDKTRQLFVAPGPDLRDWSKIEAGALDYSHIAYQEHQAHQDNPAKEMVGQPFPGHDGAKAAAACTICAAKNGVEPVMAYAVPAEVPADVQAANDQHAAQAAAEAAQAARDADAKTLIPPSREVRDDQAKQAKMDAQRAELDAQEARIAGMLSQLQGTGTATTVNSDQAAAADQDLMAESVAALPDEHKAAAAQYDDPDTRPTMGTDPWTHEQVKIFWAIDGADPDHPYGRKKDGSPRRPVGRKVGS